MKRKTQPPGSLAKEKRSESRPDEPKAAETESARLLANQARAPLLDAGLDNPMIDRLADSYIAEDRGEDLDQFIAWATERAR